MRQPTGHRKRLPRRQPAPAEVEVTPSMFPDAASRAWWLLDFLRMDLDSISVEAWRRLRRESWGFVVDGNSVIDMVNAIGVSAGLDRPDVDSGALPDLQEEIPRGTQSVQDGLWWVLNGPTRFGIARWVRVVRKGHRVGGF